MNRITVTSTSRSSAVADNIVLRSSDRVRLVFSPLLVSNPNDNNCSVKGSLVYQRKNVKSEWQDISGETLSNLKAGDARKIELKSRELLTLYEGLTTLYQIYESHGIPKGKQEFRLADHDLSEVIDEFLKSKVALKTLMKDGGMSTVSKLLTWFSRVENKSELVESLQSLDPESLIEMRSVLGVSALRSVLTAWEENLNNSDEEYWQEVFERYPIILEQLFSYPVSFFQGKAYLGGKAYTNRGGNIVDFLYKNGITDNIALIEIKTPMVSLLGSEYRKVFPIGRELGGAIAQSLNYREQIVRQFNSLVADLPEEERFRVAAPKCILVVGKLSEISHDRSRMDSFERMRHDSKGIEIITFDEVFERVKRLVEFVEDPKSARAVPT